MVKQKKSFLDKITGLSNSKENIPDAAEERQEKQEENILKDDIREEQEEIAQENEIISEESEAEPTSPSPAWQEESEGQLTVDVYQTDAEIVIKSTIAGVDANDLDVNIANDMVTIKGKREDSIEKEAKDYYYQECYWGSFSRSIILPVDVEAENAQAGLKNGILTIRLPKAEKVKTRKIKVLGS